MWWKLGALTLLAIGLVVLLVMPINTVDITVELPPPNAPLRTIDADSFALPATLIAYGFVAAVLALIGWLMWRVVRHHRSSKGQSSVRSRQTATSPAAVAISPKPAAPPSPF